MDAVYSTFALDDVKLIPGACNSPGACTFDGSLCSWYSNEELGQAEWQLGGPGELSLATRPYSDATFRSNQVRRERVFCVGNFIQRKTNKQIIAEMLLRENSKQKEVEI